MLTIQELIDNALRLLDDQKQDQKRKQKRKEEFEK
jgi:hypothetical protein